jgi:hypothetical protein
VIGQAGDHRRHHHADGNPRLSELAHGGEAETRPRRSRLELLGQVITQGGDRDEDGGSVLSRHLRNQVEVPRDEMVFRDDAERVPELGQHLDASARDLEPPLQRLIGIGDPAHRDFLYLVRALHELGAKKRRRIHLGENPRLEVDSRRKAEVLMRGPRVAVSAPVLAAPVRVDADAERDIGAVVLRENRARVVDEDFRLSRALRLVEL